VADRIKSLREVEIYYDDIWIGLKQVGDGVEKGDNGNGIGSLHHRYHCTGTRSRVRSVRWTIFKLYKNDNDLSFDVMYGVPISSRDMHVTIYTVRSNSKFNG